MRDKMVDVRIGKVIQEDQTHGVIPITPVNGTAFNLKVNAAVHPDSVYNVLRSLIVETVSMPGWENVTQFEINVRATGDDGMNRAFIVRMEDEE